MRSVRQHVTVATTVFVALDGEGVDVWRPVLAREISSGVFRLMGLVPPQESWEFQPGQIVECEPRRLSGDGIDLVAVRLAAARAEGGER